MTVLLYLSAVLFTVAQSAATKYYHKKGESARAFNAYKSAFAFFPFLLFSLFGFRLHAASIAYGFVYGILLSVSSFSGYAALKNGPMALTSMLVSFSVIMPLLYGICSGERLTLFKTLGFCLLVFAVIAVNVNKQGVEKPEKRKKWILSVFVTFLSNGLCSVTQKMHQTQ